MLQYIDGGDGRMARQREGLLPHVCVSDEDTGYNGVVGLCIYTGGDFSAPSPSVTQ